MMGLTLQQVSEDLGITYSRVRYLARNGCWQCERVAGCYFVSDESYQDSRDILRDILRDCDERPRSDVLALALLWIKTTLPHYRVGNRHALEHFAAEARKVWDKPQDGLYDSTTIPPEAYRILVAEGLMQPCARDLDYHAAGMPSLPPPETFGSHMEYTRRDMGLKAHGIARRMKITREFYRQLVSGEVRPTLAIADHIADALGHDRDEWRALVEEEQ